MFNSKEIRRTAIYKVIEENLDYLVRFAYYRVDNRQDAEDIVHEAALRLIEKDYLKINPDGIRLYLFRMVYNLCRDKSRSRNYEAVSLDMIDVPDTSEEALDREEADRLHDLLEHLPSREEEVVRMNVIDGLSFVDIGKILSIPASTAKSRFKSGMDKLRKEYFTDKKS